MKLHEFKATRDTVRRFRSACRLFQTTDDRPLLQNAYAIWNDQTPFLLKSDGFTIHITSAVEFSDILGVMSDGSGVTVVNDAAYMRDVSRFTETEKSDTKAGFPKFHITLDSPHANLSNPDMKFITVDAHILKTLAERILKQGGNAVTIAHNERNCPILFMGETDFFYVMPRLYDEKGIERMKERFNNLISIVKTRYEAWHKKTHEGKSV